MSAMFSIDSATCSRVCLTLLHSLWQTALALGFAEALIHAVPRLSAQRSCTIFSLALIGSLFAVPITYRVLPSERLPSEVVSVSRSTDPLAAESREPALVDLPPATISRSLHEPAIDGTPGLSAWRQVVPWLFGLYVLGFTLMLTVQVRGLVHDHRTWRGAQLINSGPALDHLRRLCRRCNVRSVPLLAQTDGVVVPKLIGLLRPAIVLPTAALTGLAPAEMEMVLAHELAHFRRRDMWVQVIQRCAELTLFFNPAIWYLSRRISSFREYCCDDMTCDTTACQPIAYARLLLRLAEVATGHRWASEWNALAVAGKRPSELRRRVSRLLREPVRQPLSLASRGLTTFTLTVAMLSLGWFVWPAQGQVDDGQVRDDAMTRQFESGTVVELVGIGNGDFDNQQWWDSKGRRLGDLNLKWNGVSRLRNSSIREMTHSVAIRIRHRPENAHVTWRLQASGTEDSGSFSWYGLDAPEGIFGRYFKVTDEQTKVITVPVGIAAGEWTTVGASSTGSSLAMGRDGHSLIFSLGFEASGDGSVIVSHDYFDDDFRIVAYDREGNLHPQRGRGGYSAGRIYQCRATFPGLPLAEIERFEFQTRTYQWVYFRDLPLAPR